MCPLRSSYQFLDEARWSAWMRERVCVCVCFREERKMNIESGIFVRIALKFLGLPPSQYCFLLCFVSFRIARVLVLIFCICNFYLSISHHDFLSLCMLYRMHLLLVHSYIFTHVMTYRAASNDISSQAFQSVERNAFSLAV